MGDGSSGNPLTQQHHGLLAQQDLLGPAAKQ
jgi:hypothetical protein